MLRKALCYAPSPSSFLSFSALSLSLSLSLFYLFIFLVVLGFELRASCLQSLNHIFNQFCSGYIGDRVSQNICLDWPQTLILPISASQVAGMTGVSTFLNQLVQEGHWELTGR
jgi:hypothetical protein